MYRPMFRLAAAALLLLPLAACGGGGGEPTQPPPPSPAASIALGAATSSIAAGGTANVTITVTRSNGFAGAVTVTPTGLPTGVTAAPLTIAANASSGTLTLTAAANAPAATATAVSITATGTGVTISAQPLALTVVGGNGASLALASNAGTLEAGLDGRIIVTVTRTGSFTGSVTVAVTGLPTGLTATSQTLAAGVTTDTIPLASTLGLAAGTTNLTITGTASGVTIAPQTYALTTTLGPIAPLGNDMTSGDGQFGGAIALNADGSRIVVGAGTTANGTTRVYQRTGTTWAQLGADIIGEASGDRAGSTVSINAAGTRIAVGAYLNDANGINSGHVRVYDLVGGAWAQVGADIDGVEESRAFGTIVALSGTGDRLAVSASDIGGGTGTVRVFDLVNNTWTQVGNTVGGNNEFGYGLDLSNDGTTFAVGATDFGRRGEVYVYRLTGNTWAPLGNTLAGEEVDDLFGTSVALTANGSRIVVGAPFDKEAGAGTTSGKVRVFDLVGTTWTQVGGDILGSGGASSERLGERVSISDDGARIAVGSLGSSLARVFTFTAGAWTQTGPTILNYGAARAEGLVLSPDGRSVAVGYVNGVPRIVRVFRITP